jgi:hypothetical protein
MTVELAGIELLSEMQQWIVREGVIPGRSHAALDHLARSPLTEQADARRQVSAHPFVTAGDDKVGDRQAVVERDVAERLSRVDEAEPKFASPFDPLHDVANREADSQMIHGRQKESVALMLGEGGGEIAGDIVHGPAAIQNSVS